MTRALQDRLALANIKIKHGWQHRSIESLEPEIDRELKRKRDLAQLDLYSDTSSNVSGPFSSGAPASSPFSAPMLSDDLPRPTSAKRYRMDPPVLPNARMRTRNNTRASSSHTSPMMSWNSAYALPESSPSFRRRTRLAEAEHASYSSGTSTVVDESPSGSEDDDEDIPLHSFQTFDPPHLDSSPPRTPPPSFTRSAHLRPQDFSATPNEDSKHPGKEGADLLLYLASSPSPAMRVHRSESLAAPSTPPTKTTPLPSSLMHTPGTSVFWGAPHTPGTAGFNFADFVNVTPSPAQGTWNKTPGAAKTPKIKTPAASARRRLNFDNPMLPPTQSPNLSTTPRSTRRNDGLGMELGEELAPSR